MLQVDRAGAYHRGLVLNLKTPHPTPHTTPPRPRFIEPLPTNPDGTPVDDPGREARQELAELSGSLADTQVLGHNTLQIITM